MISHGSAHFLREKLFINSDKFITHVCKNCGLFAIANIKQSLYTCKNCKQNGINSDIAKIEIPYASKLLFQELMGMQIGVRFKFDKEEEH